MAINKKLIHFNKKSDFESEVAKGNILNYSICFIADTKEIYTHGNYYSQVSEAPTDGQKYIRVNGAWYVLSDSSSSTSGLMSAIDKTKLDGIESGAQKNTVLGVKGNSESSYRTGNINITKANIGLGNVDNTSDLNKPVSTAQQTALDKKVDKVTGYGLSKNDFTDTLKNKLDGIAKGAQVNSITGVKGSSEGTYRTGNVSISASNIGLGNVNNTSDADKPISTATQTALNGKVSTTVKVNGHALSADVTVSKSDVGLSNVDNTSDANKPVSTAQQTALDKKVNKTTTVNGHALSGNVTVTKADVGLGNVDNTSDVNKPVSTAQQAALDKKVNKVAGKGLSTNDYTTDEKNKLAGIAAGAQVNVIESVKVNGTAQTISNKEVDIPVPTNLSQLTNDIYEVATSAEITAILN